LCGGTALDPMQRFVETFPATQRRSLGEMRPAILPFTEHEIRVTDGQRIFHNSSDDAIVRLVLAHGDFSEVCPSPFGKTGSRKALCRNFQSVSVNTSMRTGLPFGFMVFQPKSQAGKALVTALDFCVLRGEISRNENRFIQGT